MAKKHKEIYCIIFYHGLCVLNLRGWFDTTGYQLTSAECYDLRSNRVVADQYCHYYPENVKPKPKLQECNLDPCPARSVKFASLFVININRVPAKLLKSFNEK